MHGGLVEVCLRMALDVWVWICSLDLVNELNTMYRFFVCFIWVLSNRLDGNFCISCEPMASGYLSARSEKS